RRVALGFGDRTRMGQALPQLVDRVTDVRAQHVLAEELMEHLSYRALEEGDAAGVPRAVPRVRAVLRVVDQRTEERRCQGIEIALRFANDVAGDELGRVLESMDEAVQLAQDVVRDVPRRSRLAVEVDRDLRVLEADLLDEGAQALQGGLRFRGGASAELLVVDGENERRSARLLLRVLRQIVIAGDPQDLQAFLLDGC